jgi:hypothetical protein
MKTFYGLFLCLIASLLAGRVIAQSTNAAITGRVTDPAKAVIGSAQVAAINTGTNVRYEAATNGTGSFVIPDLPPGPYRVEVEKPGFKTIVETGVVLHVQDTVELNFEMAVGAVAESITVNADQNNINTTDATVSTVVDRQFAENLPMNGRSFQTLIQLTPGVVLTPTNAYDSGQFSINGQRADSNYWTVDGVSANFGISSSQVVGNGMAGSAAALSAFGGTNSLVSIDALQEFRIQTSTYAPEFGRTPGGQISIVTRSGGNRFHGDIFDYFRNDALDANDWFADFNHLPKPEERQNDFGGTLGGPIIKDRTFFFFSYEGLRLRLPQVEETLVPDLTARQSAVPTMQPYLNAFPLPNGSDSVASGVAQFNASFSNPSSLDAYSLRIDHKLTQAITLFGRYNYSPSNFIGRGDQGTGPLNAVSPVDINTQTLTLGATWTINTAMVNDFRFNFSRIKSTNSYYQDDFGGAVPLKLLPFPSSSLDASNSAFSFRIYGLGQADQYNIGTNAQNLQRQINVVDNLTVQKDTHTLKLGVDFRRLSPVFNFGQYGQLAGFLSVTSAESGNAYFSDITSFESSTLLFRNLATYAEDAWRATPGLTVTYGVRWDIDFVPRSLNGPDFPAVTGFNLANLTNLNVAPAGTPPYKTTYGNFAPRVGIAYQLIHDPHWQTVLRGGFGVFYDLASSEAGNAIGPEYPFGSSKLTFGGAFPLDLATAAPLPISLATVPSGYLFFFDPQLKLPYTLEWNVALEQALGSQQTISASYIGSDGRRLLQTANIFAPNANIGTASPISNTGTSNYNALQLQFQRRLSQGLQVLASYTWSHSIDTGSSGSIGNASNAFVPGLSADVNRGPSDFDIRNALSVGITYDIPAPRLTHPINAILHGWSAQSVVQAHSAPPVNVYSTLFGFDELLGAYTLVRPDVVQGIPFYLYGSQYPGGKILNDTPNEGGVGCIGPFCPPPMDPTTGEPERQGDLGRNALRGFGASQWDLAIHRDFPVHETLKLQFRAEMFNILNHPNFAAPISDLSNPQFGYSTQMLGRSYGGASFASGALSSLYQVGGPRSIQLALKLQF